MLMPQKREESRAETWLSVIVEFGYNVAQREELVLGPRHDPGEVHGCKKNRAKSSPRR
jgi:hypothetical protein